VRARARDREAHLEAFDDELGTAEARGSVFGVSGDGGESAAIREEEALEHEHPPGEPA